jgi:predicted alpha/beta superfamily hydrolase
VEAGRNRAAGGGIRPTDRQALVSKTTIEVLYPRSRGSVELRGSVAPLSWTASTAPSVVEDQRQVFELDCAAGELIEFKPIRDGRLWASGRNYSVTPGDSIAVRPYFERINGVLEPELQSLESPQLGRSIRYRLFLPPSYDELADKRYPVLYAQDGQNLFTPDPIDGHSWQLHDALNELYDLGAIEELLVVAIYTDVGRLELLSPMPDPQHGGGDGPRYLDFLIETLKPAIDRRYRTLPGPSDTALIGSSMGGLFSFYGAWTRGDVFGRAACLSSSFWWNRRAMVRQVEGDTCPFPRPFLYIDSGAAKSAFEEDANLRDGYHHTMAMRSALVHHCFVPGENLHTLAFAGLSHNNASWASRLAIPIQLLFPRRG